MNALVSKTPPESNCNCTGSLFTSTSCEHDHFLKSLEQNVPCGMSCVAYSLIWLKPHIVRIQIMQFRPKEIRNQLPIVVAIGCGFLVTTVLNVI